MGMEATNPACWFLRTEANRIKDRGPYSILEVMPPHSVPVALRGSRGSAFAFKLSHHCLLGGYEVTSDVRTRDSSPFI